jgi:hypothetical protein
MHMSAGDVSRPPVFGGNIGEGRIETASAASGRLFLKIYPFPLK